MMIPHFYLRITFVAPAILFLLTVSMFKTLQYLNPTATSTTGIIFANQPEVASSHYPVKRTVDMTLPHNNTLTTKTTIRRLQHDWNYHPPQSHLAQLIHAHQTNCSNQNIATYYSDNHYGIGSHVAVWSQGICQAMQQHRRLQTINPTWLWLDQNKCDMTIQTQKSPWSCYFPMAEPFCPQHPQQQQQQPEALTVNISIPRDHKRHSCQFFAKGDTNQLKAFRAASTEVLFQRVSLLVIAEAERQLRLLFGEDEPPEDLITVHIRWGDKFWEMDLVSIQEYLQAISNILVHHQGKRDNSTASIYLATEDPRAAQEFKTAIPPGWKVYYDLTVAELSTYRPLKGNRASHMARNTQGRAGLVGLGSLLLAMEAKWFVLTTASNWSRMMDHLRTQIINPRCNNCTFMVDLRPGIW